MTIPIITILLVIIWFLNKKSHNNFFFKEEKELRNKLKLLVDILDDFGFTDYDIKKLNLAFEYFIKNPKDERVENWTLQKNVNFIVCILAFELLINTLIYFPI